MGNSNGALNWKRSAGIMKSKYAPAHVRISALPVQNSTVQYGMIQYVRYVYGYSLR